MPVMPKRMQALKLRDELKGLDIDADLVDLEAEIDSQLSYSDNSYEILKKYKSRIKKIEKKSSPKVDITDEMRQAAQRNAARSIQAQEQDKNLHAKTTITAAEIKRNPAVLDKWYKDPAHYDIEGIDSHIKSIKKVK